MELKELLFKTLEKAEEALELPYEQRNDSESLNQAALELAKTGLLYTSDAADEAES